MPKMARTQDCWEFMECGGAIAGTFAEKFRNCQQCLFYALVKREEHPDFKSSAILLSEMVEPEGE